jgi:uncharacterized protein
MRLGDARQSENIEDRRGSGGYSTGIGVAGGGLGAIAIVVIGLLFGVDPGTLLQIVAGDQAEQGGSGTSSSSPLPRDAAGRDDLKQFVSQVLAETEDTWSEVFSRMNRSYENPRLVLYSGFTSSACGTARSAVGPFYCPGDRRVYLDLDFFRELRDRFHASGDFAEAYVIAHEVGHHVQNLLGVMDRVERQRQQADKASANALSVRLELQADCLAGVWARQADSARHILEAGDIEQGINAASAVGDDRLQMQAQGYVVPESFTHGSSAQRVGWFKRGLRAGTIKDCDTFSSASP